VPMVHGHLAGDDPDLLRRDDPPVPDVSEIKNVMIDWEGEWSGGAFVEGDDLEA
jgi:hypothetical protein